MKDKPQSLVPSSYDYDEREKNIQELLANKIERSKNYSMIYGMSKKNKRGNGCIKGEPINKVHTLEKSIFVIGSNRIKRQID